MPWDAMRGGCEISEMKKHISNVDCIGKGEETKKKARGPAVSGRRRRCSPWSQCQSEKSINKSNVGKLIRLQLIDNRCRVNKMQIYARFAWCYCLLIECWMFRSEREGDDGEWRCIALGAGQSGRTFGNFDSNRLPAIDLNSIRPPFDVTRIIGGRCSYRGHSISNALFLLYLPQTVPSECQKRWSDTGKHFIAWISYFSRRKWMNAQLQRIRSLRGRFVDPKQQEGNNRKSEKFVNRNSRNNNENDGAQNLQTVTLLSFFVWI